MSLEFVVDFFMNWIFALDTAGVKGWGLYHCRLTALHVDVFGWYGIYKGFRYTCEAPYEERVVIVYLVYIYVHTYIESHIYVNLYSVKEF